MPLKFSVIFSVLIATLMVFGTVFTVNATNNNGDVFSEDDLGEIDCEAYEEEFGATGNLPGGVPAACVGQILPERGLCVGTTCVKREGIFHTNCSPSANDPNTGWNEVCAGEHSYYVCEPTDGGGYACVRREGLGESSCRRGHPEDCVNESHYKCVEDRCVLFPGFGDDTCAPGAPNECKTERYNICVSDARGNQRCEIDAGYGIHPDQCNSTRDCESEQYQICEFKNDRPMCERVPGFGYDECNHNNECESEDIVMECIMSPHGEGIEVCRKVGWGVQDPRCNDAEEGATC